MDVVETRAGCRARLDAARATGRTVGLVPTMGALHEGHLSLMARARAECDVVVVSIFVNPLQFGDPDDIANYPRTLERDLPACARSRGRPRLRAPVGEMYPTWPEPPATTVSVRGVSDGWEGASRPGHFDGVATVVAKLFAIAGPCRAYFGLKDFQQLAVVRRMALDLSLPGRGRGLPDRARGRRAGPLEPQRAPGSGRARRPPPCCPGPWPPAGPPSRPASARPPRCTSSWPAVVGHRAARRAGLRRRGGRADAASSTRPWPTRPPARLLMAARVGPVRLIDNCAALDAADDVDEAVPADRPRAAGDARQLERIG